MRAHRSPTSAARKASPPIDPARLAAALKPGGHQVAQGIQQSLELGMD
jgi:hypothetical protein